MGIPKKRNNLFDGLSNVVRKNSSEPSGGRMPADPDLFRGEDFELVRERDRDTYAVTENVDQFNDFNSDNNDRQPENN